VQCGVERWAVKTLQDGAANRVNFTPRRTSVVALRRLTPPPTLGARTSPVETRTYRVAALLLSAKIEADSDIHLVIAQPGHGSQTMIVEFPNPGCTPKASKSAKSSMKSARASFLRACGTPSASSFTPLSGRAIITGVGFFDFKHGQRGVAPNAIELHPVLSFVTRRCA
jgi:hypothetical protein